MQELSQFMSLVSEETKKANEIAEEKRRIEEEKKERLSPRISVGESLSDFFNLISESKKLNEQTSFQSVDNPMWQSAQIIHTNFEEEPRIPKTRKNQDPDTHSDLYTDENPKGTIQGLGFKDVETAKASVKKIESSNRTHAHKIQAAVAMEQRAKVMGKTAEAKVYRDYIEKMKEKTKEMNKEENQDKIDILKVFFERLDSFEQTLEQKTTVAEKSDMANKMSKFLPEAPKQLSELEALKRDFRVFKEMVTRQMSSIGGGGSVNLLEMDDVDTSSLGNGKFLVFNSTTNKLEFTDQVDGN
jgi:hypothetical protein